MATMANAADAANRRVLILFLGCLFVVLLSSFSWQVGSAAEATGIDVVSVVLSKVILNLYVSLLSPPGSVECALFCLCVLGVVVVFWFVWGKSQMANVLWKIESPTEYSLSLLSTAQVVLCVARNSAGQLS